MTDDTANTAVGYQALKSNNGGDNNTAVGHNAGLAVVNGGNNTLIGTQAGVAVTSGANNTLIGQGAGGVLTTGNNNVVVGRDTDLAANSNNSSIIIGEGLTGLGSNTTLIGSSATTKAVVHGLVKPIGGGASNIAVALPNNIYTFSDADGATITLPDSGGNGFLGATIEFVITTSATSNSHKIILADTTNEKFIGTIATIDTDNDNAATFYTPATSNKAITMNGTTTGIVGSRIRVTNIATDIWSVEGTILHTGNTATPFSNS